MVCSREVIGFGFGEVVKNLFLVFLVENAVDVIINVDAGSDRLSLVRSFEE